MTRKVHQRNLSRVKGSLTVVGTGIRSLGHVSLEAVGHLEHAQKVFYLTADPLGEALVRSLNRSAESLHDSYAEGKPRTTTYEEIVERILGPVRKGRSVCAAFYGHPGVFVYPSHEAVRRAKREGFTARMLPAISAADCLFADLGIDPAYGCQMYEATDLLLTRRRIDPSSHLILFQVGIIGERSIRTTTPYARHGLPLLSSFLRRFYPERHPVVLYEAAEYPLCEPSVDETSLARLPTRPISPGATLYVPPREMPRARARVLRQLKLVP